MKKTVIIALHTGYWFLYALLLSLVFILSRTASLEALEDWDDLLVILAMATVTGVASFYVCYLWLVPRYLIRRRIGAFITSALFLSVLVGLLATVIFSLAITGVVYFFMQKLEFFLFSTQDSIWLLGGFTLLAVVNGIMGTVTRGFIAWYNDIQEKQELESSKLQTELALLKAQINPHFLFNTLNNIDVLIGHNPESASLFLNKLSDLLRYVLYETQVDWIPLESELAYMAKYIDLQKIRTENEYFVSFKIEGSASGLMIPPMILLPYMENAFKFATNKKIADAIRISVIIGKEQILFSCVNVIDKNRQGKTGTQNGLGNDLLRRRLSLLYKDQYKLSIQATETEYSVNLYLPITNHELFAG